MKKTKPFTREEVLELFYYCPQSNTGLKWNINYKHHKKGDVAGYEAKVGDKSFEHSRRYGHRWHVCFNGRPHIVSRIIWTLENGEIPKGYVVDHRNGNPRDNHIENLCLKTHAENVRARTKKNSNNKTGMHCVEYAKKSNTWTARVKRGGKFIICRRFKTKEEAAKAVDDVSKKWALANGEECRILNFN